MLEKIALLKEIASKQKISVDYGTNTKSYKIPMAAFLLSPFYDPLSDDDDDMSVYVDCEYVMQLGQMFVKCDIFDGNDTEIIPEILIPLEKRRQNATQRELMSLINLCAKRVIAQEISRNKYAIVSAINSTYANKEYN